MDKRGFIKTLEAVLAIIVVFIFIFSVGHRSDNEKSQSEIMADIQEGLLKGIVQSESYRECIINTPEGANIPIADLCPGVVEYIEDTLPSRFKGRYRIQVCDVDKCVWQPPNQNYLYTSAVVVSSDLDVYNPKIFRIWMW